MVVRRQLFRIETAAGIIISVGVVVPRRCRNPGREQDSVPVERLEGFQACSSVPHPLAKIPRPSVREPKDRPLKVGAGLPRSASN